MLEFWRLPAGSGQKDSLGLGVQQQLGVFIELAEPGQEGMKGAKHKVAQCGLRGFQPRDLPHDTPGI